MFTEMLDFAPPPRRVSFALVAYAGTSKDTFVREVQAGRLGMASFRERAAEAARWLVYATKERDVQPLTRLLPDALDSAGAPRTRRYAFADALKERTHEWLGFRDCLALAFEAVKDTLIARVPHGDLTATMRQHYISYGQACRREDPLVWAKIVAQKIQEADPAEIDARPSMPATIRLFREEVKVAPPLESRAVDSEHNLDSFLTDYLFVPPGQFPAALQRFPQYAHYTPRVAVTEKKTLAKAMRPADPWDLFFR